MSFTYEPVEETTAPYNYEDLARRLLHLEALQQHERVDIERAAPALIGTVEPNEVTITKALELYLSEIALDEVAGKSPEQRVHYNGEFRTLGRLDDHNSYVLLFIAVVIVISSRANGRVFCFNHITLKVNI